MDRNTSIDIEEIIKLIETLESNQVLYADYTFTSSDSTVELSCTFPPVIIFSSDWHLGSIYTDYASMVRMLKLIMETNSYIVVVGDLIDNFEHPILSTKTVNSQLITPALQRDIMIKLLTLLIEKKKLIAMVLGNHENFTSPYPYQQLLFSAGVVSYNRLFLRLNVRDQIYKIALVHRSRFNSFLNPVHSSWRELTLNYPDSDIVVTSHTHVPALSVYYYPQDNKLVDRILVKTGTLKFDPYMLNFTSAAHNSVFATPAVVLSTQRRKIIPFHRAEDALKMDPLLFLLE